MADIVASGFDELHRGALEYRLDPDGGIDEIACWDSPVDLRYAKRLRILGTAQVKRN